MKIKRKKKLTYKQALAKKRKSDAKRKIKKRKRKKISNLEKLKRECDDLTREIVFKRDHFTCQKSMISQAILRAKKSKLDPHHVKGRGNKMLRWDPMNVIALSREQHQAQKYHPTDFLLWFADKYPARVNYINLKKDIKFKVNIPSMKLKKEYLLHLLEVY